MFSIMETMVLSMLCLHAIVHKFHCQLIFQQLLKLKGYVMNCKQLLMHIWKHVHVPSKTDTSKIPSKENLFIIQYPTKVSAHNNGSQSTHLFGLEGIWSALFLVMTIDSVMLYYDWLSFERMSPQISLKCQNLLSKYSNYLMLGWFMYHSTIKCL